MVTRKKKVKLPKEVLASQCRTVPKTQCFDQKVTVVVVVAIMLLVVVMLVMMVLVIMLTMVVIVMVMMDVVVVMVQDHLG